MISIVLVVGIFLVSVSLLSALAGFRLPGNDRGYRLLPDIDKTQTLADKAASLEVPEPAEAECDDHLNPHVDALLASQYETYHMRVSGAN